MRKVINEQMETRISNIELNINSRDEILKLLMGCSKFTPSEPSGGISVYDDVKTYHFDNRK